MDFSVTDKILDTKEKVFGIIYKITNIEENKIYIGQTHSHRLNRKKYRPFGVEGRFKDHISKAIKNTTKTQSSYLANAIRKYTPEKFKFEVVEYCAKEDLDDREKYYIKETNSIYPNGYNLTPGGKTARHKDVPTMLEKSLLNKPGKRGGCKFRSKETREKIKKQIKSVVDDKFRTLMSVDAKIQHNRTKIKRFKDCKIEDGKIDTYIKTKGKVIIVCIDGIKCQFTSKYETIEESKTRAREFIEELKMQRYQTAGNPL
jgi:group I intron endonuclease